MRATISKSNDTVSSFYSRGQVCPQDRFIPQFGSERQGKSKEVPTEVLTFIDRQMPRHTVFLLQQNDDFCLFVNYKEWHDATNAQFDIVKAFQTEWTTANDLSLELDGRDLDAIYSSIIKQIAGAGITSEAKDIHSAVAQSKEQEALLQKIAALEAKVAKERQPKKKFELHRQLVELKNKIKTI